MRKPSQLFIIFSNLATSATVVAQNPKLGHISLDPSWGKEHTASYETLKQQLTNQVKLSYPKEDYDLVLCTDASETHWTGVMTQVPKDQLDQPLEEQHHEPLGFLSGTFGGPSKSWSIVENEAYAVVEAMIRFEHIVFGRLFHIQLSCIS
jgi:RNase H-like domain found in reverse transcriptase